MSNAEALFPGVTETLTHFQRWAESWLRRSISSKPGEATVVAWRSMIYLKVNLNRFISMTEGVGQNLQVKNPLVAGLALRGAIETLGGLAYLLDRLLAHYDQDSSEPIAETLERLLLGGRGPRRDPQAISVLTLVDKIDKRLEKRLALADRDFVFRANYDLLSEACHPNMFGLFAPGAWGEVIFEGEDERPPLITGPYLLNRTAFACDVYRTFHKDCYHLLRENERMPLIEDEPGSENNHV